MKKSVPSETYTQMKCVPNEKSTPKWKSVPNEKSTQIIKWKIMPKKIPVYKQIHCQMQKVCIRTKSRLKNHTHNFDTNHPPYTYNKNAFESSHYWRKVVYTLSSEWANRYSQGWSLSKDVKLHWQKLAACILVLIIVLISFTRTKHSCHGSLVYLRYMARVQKHCYVSVFNVCIF